MSIITNLYQGVSGLNTNSTRMEVVGNNIANVNTVGFKAGRVHFSEILGRTVLGASGAGQIGAGAQVDGVEQVFSQGAFAATGQATDLAIAGEGFFMVNGAQGGTDGTFFTRAGQFRMDNEGFITTPGGLKLQGFTAGSNGEVGSKLGDLKVPTDPIPPKGTGSVDMKVGLDSTTEVRAEDEVFSLDDPTSTSDFTSTVTVFDNQGNAHQVDVHFRKTADNQWTWHAVAPSDEVGGGDTQFTEIGTGTLTFDESGNLQTETGGSLSATFGAAGSQTIALDFGTSIDEGGDGSGASNQFSESGNQTIALEQDGRASGVLQGIRVDTDGTIIGAYSNGEELAVGRVATARFAAPTALNNAGGNLFTATGASGQPVIGEPGVGGQGSIMGGALEQSNVDLASEFVSMITAQRGFQANARTITTADELYAETVNLKR